MPFVIMRAPAQNQNRRAAHCADHQLSSMPAHARTRESRKLGVRNPDLRLHFINHPMKAAAQHQRQFRPERTRLLDALRGNFGIERLHDIVPRAVPAATATFLALRIICSYFMRSLTVWNLTTTKSAVTRDI